MSSEKPPRRIVILGGGFAGVATASALESRLRPGEAEINLVSRENFSLFTPLLPEVSSGGLGTRHVVTPVRAELRRTQFVLSEVTGIDLEARRVDVVHPLLGKSRSIDYDQLVIALGGVTSTFNLPGVAERSLALKTLEDAEALRNHIIATLEVADVTTDPIERKRLLTYVIVGGGYTGVECAGELTDFFKSIQRFYRTVRYNEISIVLIEGGKQLLPELPPKMGRYSAEQLTGRNVQVIVNDLVSHADDDGIALRSGTRFATRTIVWSAGTRPSPLLQALPVEHARGGAIIVCEDMSVPNRPGVWAAGDCAAIPTGVGPYYPPTAQHAIREGPVLARNVIATLRGEATRPFIYKSLGSMASLGARRGVAEMPWGGVLTGFPAWFLWRTYYLARLPGLDRKIRVAFDWTVGLLFPRDISELRIYTERAQAMANLDRGMRPRA